MLQEAMKATALGRRARSVPLDALRGLAILAMIADHAAKLAELEVIRWSVGRLAMPVFMLIAGALVRRLKWRLLWIAALGIALPILYPWMGQPDILVAYAVGAVVVLIVQAAAAGASRSLATGYAVAGIAAVTLAANGIEPWMFGAVALMVIGAALGPARIEQAATRVPRWLARIGRRPLTWYVAHIVALDVLVYLGWFG